MGKKLIRLLYFSNSISLFGDMLTNLGILIFLSKNYGSSSVAGSFFVAILPQLWLTEALTVYFQKYSLIKLMIINRLLGAFLVSALIFFQNLSALYIFLLLSSCLMSFQLNLQRSFVGLVVPREQLSTVHRKLSSLKAIIIMLAPACGGWIMENISISALFFLDAITFLASASFFLFMRNIKEREGEELKPSQTIKKIFSKWHPIILAWCLFLVIGSFHNATQVSILESVGLRTSQIGLVLMFWGVGGFLAFVFPQRLGSFLSLPLSVMIFTVFLSLYLTGLSFVFSSICMMICGFFYSFIIGEMRAEISSLVKKKSSSLLLWAFVGKRSAWLQFYVYLLLMLSLKFFPPEAYAYAVCLIGFFLSYLVEKKVLTKRA